MNHSCPLWIIKPMDMLIVIAIKAIKGNAKSQRILNPLRNENTSTFLLDGTRRLKYLDSLGRILNIRLPSVRESPSIQGIQGSCYLEYLIGMWLMLLRISCWNGISLE